MEMFFETMEGILHFSIHVFQIQRYGCDMANLNHRTDIKYVLKTIIFKSHWTMRARMIFNVFSIHTIQRKSKYVYLQYMVFFHQLVVSLRDFVTKKITTFHYIIFKFGRIDSAEFFYIIQWKVSSRSLLSQNLEVIRRASALLPPS